MGNTNEPTFFSTFFVESRKTILLALPMILGQVGQVLLSVVDTIMVGRVGVDPVAGVAFGGGLMLFFFIIAMGLCSAVHVKVAHASGSGSEREHKSSEALKHGIWIVLAYSIPLALIIQFGINMLDYFGQPEEVLAHAKPYTIFMAWSLIPGLVFRCMRNYAEAQEKPWIPFWVIVFAVCLNAFLNWIFIFGRFGTPAMGAAGAGLGTLLARITGVSIYAIILWKLSPFKFGYTLKNFFQCKWATFKDLLHIGIPSTVQIGFEFGYFTFATIMMGWLGAVELAAQQITTNYTGVMFMFPLGLGFATTIRVGQQVGQKNFQRTQWIGLGGITLGGLVMGIIAIITYIFKDQIPHIFIKDQEAIIISASVLAVAALLQLWDGMQVTAMAALRGLPDMKIPLYIVIVSYWIIGIPAGYLFGFTWGLGAPGIWYGLTIGLVVSSIALTYRYKLVTKRLLA